MRVQDEREEEEEEEEEVILRPGDVLYHPAGVFHHVECLEDSLAINVSLYASSYADLIALQYSRYSVSTLPFVLRPLPARPTKRFLVFFKHYLVCSRNSSQV